MHVNQTVNEIEVGKEFLDNYKGKGNQTNPYKVLRRIFDFSCSAEAIKNSDGSVIFSWRDIKTPQDESEDGKRLKKYITAAIEKWPMHYEALNQRAADRGLEHYPTIELEEIGGGAGNVTKYRIKLRPISRNTSIDIRTLKEGYISYTVEVSDTRNPLIKFVDGLTAKGIKLHLMVGTMLSAMIIGVLVLLGGLYLINIQASTYGFIKTAFDISVTIGAIYLVFSPIYYCIMNRIIIAPTVLSPLDHYSTQLEFSPTEEKRKNGSPIRQFRIVSYVGKCLVCGVRVDVEKGKGAMSGRLMGKCSNSPLEHVYSFDHNTRIGKLLHEEYIDTKSPNR